MRRLVAIASRRALSTAPLPEPVASITQTAMYNWRVRAVWDALAKAGKAEGPIDVEDLSALGHLDQYHYLGTQACDEVIELLGLGPGSTVFDVGSGIGGPARYMAAQSGCCSTSARPWQPVCMCLVLWRRFSRALWCRREVSLLSTRRRSHWLSPPSSLSLSSSVSST